MNRFIIYLPNSERKHFHADTTKCDAINQDDESDGGDFTKGQEETVYKVIHWSEK
jgi:hypothetical protein